MKTKRTLQAIVPSLLIPLLVPLGALAAPSITSMSNSALTNGQVVTISGSGFGTKSTVAPQFWDTVENQTAYSSLANGATVPTGSGKPWESQCTWDGGACVKYSTTASEQRGLSTATYRATTTTQGLLEGRRITGTNKIYVSWWWKPASNPVTGDHSSKFLRLSNNADVTNKTFSWTQMQDYIYRTDQGYCQNGAAHWANWNGNVNQWNFHEVWIDGATRTYTIKINGKATANNVSWSSCTAFNFDYVWMIGWDGGGNSPPAITSWLDDIYVDNTLSRVMICDNANFSSATKCEMQIPTNTWTDGQLQVAVNQGSFPTNSTAYLYVVDANGSPSASKQITFGASSGGGTATIAPPSGLKVVN
ncbi:hypothetical protein [Geobacter anodireducens]|uniref:IPT/TIG domain-containing protein n=1 Tax=Geobacter anodireducens TaxID=1340425 RepID=A0ABR9NR45_9BACT|nr:hypothetical protein [Geobacter anodireducens]MBE2886736.1 hypothetical protein [Geobacter anodireducens]